MKFSSSKSITSQNEGISIIVAVRNGELSLKQIINNLKNQDYRGAIEFLLIDDESTDNTKQIILDTASEDNRFKYYSSSAGSKLLKHKKKALDVGISNASYSYLLFTDVDCSLPSTWASTMGTYFSNGHDYLVGCCLTKYDKNSNYISKFQHIDFLLLMIMCRSSAYFGYPLASSGQNQGFTKELYLKVGGFQKINSFIGDDTAFLQLCKGGGANPCFIDQKSAQILSRQEFRMSDFLLQRTRWASDANKIWKLNINFFLILFSTFLFYLSLPILLIFNHVYIYLIIGLLSVKILIEYLLIYFGCRFFSTRFIFSNFLLWEFFLIPYIIITGIMSYFIRYLTWKDRKLSL